MILISLAIFHKVNFKVKLSIMLYAIIMSVLSMCRRINKMTNEILIVDDEDRIRRLLKLYLKRESFTIHASNGKEAYNLAIENDYACILLDLMLPEMDGIEVASKLREHKDTPIIMLTAKGEETNRVEGFESGADDYIVKPFSPREVV